MQTGPPAPMTPFRRECAHDAGDCTANIIKGVITTNCTYCTSKHFNCVSISFCILTANSQRFFKVRVTFSQHCCILPFCVKKGFHYDFIREVNNQRRNAKLRNQMPLYHNNRLTSYSFHHPPRWETQPNIRVRRRPIHLLFKSLYRHGPISLQAAPTQRSKQAGMDSKSSVSTTHTISSQIRLH